ncbi:MAG: FAD-binding domain-containing protein, partial [Planctomycetota bacterium]
RGFRFFNVIKQSEQYDPEGDYVRHWCPELKHVNAKMIHAPWKLSRQQQRDAGISIGVDYPNPIVDLFESAQANQRRYDEVMNMVAADA